MTPAVLQAVLSALRSILIAVGAYLVSIGFLTSENTDQITGAVLVVVPLLWGIYQKIQSERKTKTREVIAVNVGLVVADATIGPTPAIAPAQVPAVLGAIGPRVVLPAAPGVAPFIVPASPGNPLPPEVLTSNR